jgi:hypothetical protein
VPLLFTLKAKGVEGDPIPLSGSFGRLVNKQVNFSTIIAKVVFGWSNPCSRTGFTLVTPSRLTGWFSTTRKHPKYVAILAGIRSPPISAYKRYKGHRGIFREYPAYDAENVAE